MAKPAGTTIRGYGHCRDYSDIFPLDTFELSRSIPNRARTVAEQVRPRWFGHDLSGAPDSGIGRTEDGKMCSGRVGRFGQNTFQPTIPQPIRRKRRAGGRVVTVSDAGMDVRSEGAMWGMPRKRALFGPEGQDSISSVSDAAEVQSGGRQTTRIRKRPSQDGLQTTSIRKRPGLRGWTWLMWWRAYRMKWRSSGQSPDMVATEGRRFPLGPRAGPGLRQHRYPCMRERLVGINIGKCLRLLFIRMGETVSQWCYSLCLTSKGTLSTWPCWCRHPGG